MPLHCKESNDIERIERRYSKAVTILTATWFTMNIQFKLKNFLKNNVDGCFFADRDFCCVLEVFDWNHSESNELLCTAFMRWAVHVRSPNLIWLWRHTTFPYQLSQFSIFKLLHETSFDFNLVQLLLCWLPSKEFSSFDFTRF